MAKAGTLRGEKAYQMLKLIHSGRTLAEAKSEMKAVAMGLDKEYVKPKDLNDLLSLEGGLQTIRSRGAAQDLMRIRFAPRRGLPANRAETAAKFAAGYRGNIPLNWKRDGNLIRKGKPNKPKPNSSVGKIGRTRVSGADKTLKDFRTLVRTLQRLQQEHGHRGGHKALQQAYKGVRKQVSATVKGKG